MFVTPRFILIISIFCISFNAQAKEMTIDILAGNWNCSPIIEQFSHISDDMSQLNYVDVDKEDSIGEVFWSYIKVDDKNIKIMTDKDLDDSDDIAIPFKAKLNYSEKTTDGVTNYFNEYEYVNDDEMITTDNYEELHYDTNKKLTDDSFGYKYRNRCLKVNID